MHCTEICSSLLQNRGENPKIDDKTRHIEEAATTMAESKNNHEESKLGESKGGDSKEGGTNRVLELVEQFCMSQNMEAEFDSFAEAHAPMFVQCLVIDRGGVEEHPLAFHDIYQQYLKIFEAKIEAFIVKQGFEIRDFYAQCQEIIDQDVLYGSHRFFIEALLATAEVRTRAGAG